MFSAWFIMKSLNKNSCLSLDSNPFVASKLKGGTSTSTKKVPWKSHLRKSIYPQTSRLLRDLRLLERIHWRLKLCDFSYTFDVIVYVSHIEKQLLLQKWSWGKCFCWGETCGKILLMEVHAGRKAVKCFGEAASCGISGMSLVNSLQPKLLRRQAAGSVRHPCRYGSKT